MFGDSEHLSKTNPEPFITLDMDLQGPINLHFCLSQFDVLWYSHSWFCDILETISYSGKTTTTFIKVSA